MNLRREYAEAEATQAGLTHDEIAHVVDAAMSADDFLEPDDFEYMVSSIIEGVFEQRAAFSMLDSAFGDWRVRL